MFGTQLILTGLVLVGYGFWIARSLRRLVRRFRALSRGARVALGSGYLLGGVVFLFGGLAVLMSLNAFGKGPLAPWVWLSVTGIGLGFVHFQTLGGILLATTALPTSPAQSEVRKNSQETAANAVTSTDQAP